MQSFTLFCSIKWEIHKFMSSIAKFRKHYFIWVIILLAIEIFIALFVHDRIVRPYLGDFLVVIFIYCFVRSFINAPVLAIALFSLLFSYVVETLQCFNLVGRLGLQESKLAKVILGTSFEWTDLIAYTLGILLVLYLEKVIRISPFSE